MSLSFRRRHCNSCPHFGVGLWIAIAMIPTVILIGIVMGVIFLPRHYRIQDGSTVDSEIPGQRNLSMEHVFVAASLHGDENDGTLGPWIQALLDLVDIIGHQNMFLSIYEDGPAPFSDVALEDFSALVKCNTSIVSGQPKIRVSRAKVSANDKCLKRIAHLAEVHNNALHPLVDPHSPAFHVEFHRLLFIDDIAFDPVDAANLLLSTDHDDEEDRKLRRASCATDFINPLTFSLGSTTKGTKIHSPGIPYFPWYSASRDKQSRSVLLDPRDVTSAGNCQGGMVVLGGKWFQPDGIDKSMAVAELVVHHLHTTGASSETSILAFAGTTRSATGFAAKTSSALTW